MMRREFLRLLGGLPFLGFLKGRDKSSPNTDERLVLSGDGEGHTETYWVKIPNGELRRISYEPRYPLGTLCRDVDGRRLRYVKFVQGERQ